MLSERQKEILRLIARHQRGKEIARLLKISEHTVKTHTEEARRRLGVASSRDAALLLTAYEAEIGLPPEGGPPPRAIPTPRADAASWVHEYASPQQRQADHDLERAGDSLGDPSRSGIQAPPSGTSDNGPDAGQNGGTAGADDPGDGPHLLSARSSATGTGRVSEHGMAGSGIGVEYAVPSGEVPGSYGYGGQRAGHGAEIRGGAFGPDRGLGDGLADLGGWQRFKTRLKASGPLAWIGVILLIALTAAFIFGGFLFLLLGTLEAMEQIFRRAV
ncbi:response regulator transcription factor [Asticcacaulis sp. AND118]|uniref:response regulator transcription factor n=1 Tax=Asticcacaulis sp. AND118 TaxID=2840468 RepID=UPI001CFF76C5|nr:LuxR C-terminal-related transcriptional regulator [Asticcacaulis sp. AND118]